jgi:hypothetical protein
LNLNFPAKFKAFFLALKKSSKKNFLLAVAPLLLIVAFQAPFPAFTPPCGLRFMLSGMLPMPFYLSFKGFIPAFTPLLRPFSTIFVSFSMFLLTFRQPFAGQANTKPESTFAGFCRSSVANLPHFKKKKKLSSGLNVAAAKNQKCFTKERQQQGNFNGRGRKNGRKLAGKSSGKFRAKAK